MRVFTPALKIYGAALVAGLLLLAASDPAQAFRCKSRIIKVGMHEAEVIRLCGEPVSVREIGYVIRSYSYGSRSLISRHRRYPGAYFQREVLVTEMLFNFGPRRLMRQLVFEGGILTSIRTMGYGYVEHDSQ